jgi:hypothetical protein
MFLGGLAWHVRRASVELNTHRAAACTTMVINPMTGASLRAATMMKRQLLLLLCLFAVGCAIPAEPLTPSNPLFPTVSYLKEHDNARLDQCVLVSTVMFPADSVDARPVLPIRSDELRQYALRYSPGGNDCSQGELRSDCAHFQAHCLAAGGIRVAYPTAVCDSGLTIRVRDLAIAFDNASMRYVNVKKIRDYREARRGDWCFLPREANVNPHDHLMLLAAAPEPNGARIYSHTNNRTGNFAPFDAESCLYYRIEEPAPTTQPTGSR